MSSKCLRCQFLDRKSFPAMFTTEILRFLIFSPLVIYFLLVFIKSIHRVWWIPMQIQRAMGHQGISGPAYKFIFGNTEEISKKKENSSRCAMDLSHNLLPRIMPHIYSWINIYGNTNPGSFPLVHTFYRR